MADSSCCDDREKILEEGRFDLIICIEKCPKEKTEDLVCEDNVGHAMKQDIKERINIELAKEPKKLYIKFVDVRPNTKDGVEIQADAYFYQNYFPSLWGKTDSTMKPVVENVLGITGVETLKPCFLCANVTVTYQLYSGKVIFTVKFNKPQSTKEGISESLDYLYEAVDKVKAFITDSNTLHPESLQPSQYPLVEVTLGDIKYDNTPEFILDDQPLNKAVMDFKIILSKIHGKLEEPMSMDTIRKDIRRLVDEVADCV